MIYMCVFNEVLFAFAVPEALLPLFHYECTKILSEYRKFEKKL